MSICVVGLDGLGEVVEASKCVAFYDENLVLAELLYTEVREFFNKGIGLGGLLQNEYIHEDCCKVVDALHVSTGWMLVLPDKENSCQHVFDFPHLKHWMWCGSLDIDNNLIVLIFICANFLADLCLMSLVICICEVFKMRDSQVLVLLSLPPNLLIPHVSVDR